MDSALPFVFDPRRITTGNIQSNFLASAARQECASQDVMLQRLVAVGGMTAAVAHDIRNVLAVIQAGVRLANQDNSASVESRRYLEAAQEGIDRGMSLVAQLLQFARSRADVRNRCNVNELINRAAPFLNYGVGPNVRVEVDLAQRLPDCLVDPTLFDSAILNLVLNAQHAMEEGGAVTVSTDLVIQEAGSREYVRVSVQDSGRGIPAAALKRIFEPFFTTKGAEGTGIGLPQVRAMVRKADGFLSIDTSEGSGTRVDLLIPAVGQEQTNIRACSIAASVSRGQERIHVRKGSGMVKRLKGVKKDAGASAEPRPLAQQERADLRRTLDQQLDAELKQTLPASDALTITRDRH